MEFLLMKTFYVTFITLFIPCTATNFKSCDGDVREITRVDPKVIDGYRTRGELNTSKQWTFIETNYVTAFLDAFLVGGQSNKSES